MIHSKKCFKCETIKPLNEFYVHPQMADGHVNKCKICNKKDVLKHREKNLEKIRAYDRKRAKLPERIKSCKEISTMWRQADSRRMQCHNAVHRAVKKGDLIRMPCVKCGAIKSLAHHEDYDKPLEVIWFCQPCHKQRHKDIILLLKTKSL